MQTVRRTGFWLLLGGSVFAVLPVLSLLLAVGVANMAGCDLNEGSMQPCRVLGIEVGELLYMLGVSGWYALWTIPLGGLVAFLGLISYAVARISIAHQKRTGEIQ